ncbi:transcription elongation factor GreA [Streptomyces vinaceus]|uniref:Transcription elongation factor GreA n=2 Tax=Streptomyces vinaceus TaxID=1960 RepID=A0A5J6JH53_STRVI|nr:transcription elongation factor GreA [Streptomyces vinaceus]
MTVNGSRLLREEANYRRTVRATDESKENTERIAEIDHKLANAVVVDVTKITRNGTVFFGTTVTLENADTSDEVTYQIVGEDEADIKTGKLSASDPIAKALLGKSEGDTVVVETPSGTVTYEILTVEHI